MARLSEEEKQQWDNLYQYVRKEILRYNISQAIQSKSCLRLKGLSQGKFIANNKTSIKANYSFEVVLYTFKMCKMKILQALEGKVFNDELHKMNYICVIIEGNINDVYQRLQNAKKNQKRAESTDISNIYHKGAEYKKTTERKLKHSVAELW